MEPAWICGRVGGCWSWSREGQGRGGWVGDRSNSSIDSHRRSTTIITSIITTITTTIIITITNNNSIGRKLGLLPGTIHLVLYDNYINLLPGLFFETDRRRIDGERISRSSRVFRHL